MFLKWVQKKPVEHFTVPQVYNNPAAQLGPAPRTYAHKFIACSDCTVDLYAVQRSLCNFIILPIICQYSGILRVAASEVAATLAWERRNYCITCCYWLPLRHI